MFWKTNVIMLCRWSWKMISLMYLPKFLHRCFTIWPHVPLLPTAPDCPLLSYLLDPIHLILASATCPATAQPEFSINYNKHWLSAYTVPMSHEYDQPYLLYIQLFPHNSDPSLYFLLKFTVHHVIIYTAWL